MATTLADRRAARIARRKSGFVVAWRLTDANGNTYYDRVDSSRWATEQLAEEYRLYIGAHDAVVVPASQERM